MTTAGRFTSRSFCLAGSLACSLLSVSLGAGGCATGAVARSASSAELSVDDANKIVDAYKKRHETRAANTNPLREPKSLDDVLEVLRLDEIDLFGPSAKFAANEGSARGQALAGQILISWGDGQHLLASLLRRAARELEDLRAELQRRDSATKLTGAELERLQRVEKAIVDLNGVETAMMKVANKHIQDGLALAEKVIAAAPNDYEGYRVAADYYHVREDWKKFDEMIAKLAALKPDSNGLVFLRAEAARDRDHDNVAAVGLFRDALKRDPKFTRAQVAILVLQPDLNGAYAELQKLKQVNPNHQVAVWVGPTLERQYLDWKEVNDRRRNRITDQALPGAQ